MPFDWRANLLPQLSKDAFEWVCSHLITYADDILSKWWICNEQELKQAIGQIGIIFEEQAGLVISFDKTAVLLRVEGKGMKTCIKHLTKWQDGQRWLVVPRLKGHTLIKLVSRHTYLGAQLSFTHFEQLTLRHRLQIGKITRMRMRPWFTGKHVLTSCDRAKLWATCVLSSYACGHGCSGLRKEGLQQLCKTVFILTSSGLNMLLMRPLDTCSLAFISNHLELFSGQMGASLQQVQIHLRRPSRLGLHAPYSH